MSFKRPHSDSPSIEKELNGGQKRSHTRTKVCLVCGDRASIFNYGGLSCQSCKTFFRRNASHPEYVRPCFFNRTCEINMTTRRICTECRLSKCLSVGMTAALIRKEVQRTDKPSVPSTDMTVAISKHKPSPCLIPTLDLLRADRSTLVSSEWTLLSNIVHAHDRFSSIPQVRRRVEEVFPSQLALPFEVSDVLETVLLMYTSTKAFLSSAPDYRILTTSEQSSLLERNLHGILSLVSIIFMRCAAIFDTPKCLGKFIQLYGTEKVSHARQINSELDGDLTILKVFLLILGFSSNCFIVDPQTVGKNDSFIFGTFRLLGSQNVYVELLWKYMLYRYGFQTSVLRFAKLIELFLAIINHCGQIYTNNDTHHHLVDGVVNEMKQSLVIDQNDDELLWGKTSTFVRDEEK